MIDQEASVLVSRVSSIQKRSIALVWGDIDVVVTVILGPNGNRGSHETLAGLQDV
jgi:hypothetical protein